jgi:hypothetical protein
VLTRLVRNNRSGRSFWSSIPRHSQALDLADYDAGNEKDHCKAEVRQNRHRNRWSSLQKAKGWVSAKLVSGRKREEHCPETGMGVTYLRQIMWTSHLAATLSFDMYEFRRPFFPTTWFATLEMPRNIIYCAYLRAITTTRVEALFEETFGVPLS